MNFGQAISSGFRKYVQFGGVASRSEYWWWTLFCALVSIVLSGLESGMTGESNVRLLLLPNIWSLAILLPSLAVAVRRLRDAGYAWGFLFLFLIPIVGGIVLIVLLCQPSKVTAPALYARPIV